MDAWTGRYGLVPGGNAANAKAPGFSIQSQNLFQRPLEDCHPLLRSNSELPTHQLGQRQFVPKKTSCGC